LLSGCARDAAKTAKIVGTAITQSPATTASPVIPNPPQATVSKVDTLVDAGSQGGVDSVQTHETTSGSMNLSSVSVGGTVRKRTAVSAHFKVQGGIYVQ
jgi:hypothetical protein